MGSAERDEIIYELLEKQNLEYERQSELVERQVELLFEIVEKTERIVQHTRRMAETLDAISAEIVQN